MQFAIRLAELTHPGGILFKTVAKTLVGEVEKRQQTPVG